MAADSLLEGLSTCMIALSTWLLCVLNGVTILSRGAITSIAPVHDEVAKLATGKSGSYSDTSSLTVDDNSIGKRPAMVYWCHP